MAGEPRTRAPSTAMKGGNSRLNQMSERQAKEARRVMRQQDRRAEALNVSKSIVQEIDDMYGGLRQKRMGGEEKRREFEVKTHYQAEENYLRVEYQAEIGHLLNIHQKQRVNLLARQTAMEKQSSTESTMALKQNLMRNEVRNKQLRINELEEVQELMLNINAVSRQKRNVFRQRMLHLEQRHGKERKELMASQEREIVESEKILQIGSILLSEEERSLVQKLHQLEAQQEMLESRKEIEQLHEQQLLSLKHKSEEFELRFTISDEMDAMIIAHRMANTKLLAEHRVEMDDAVAKNDEQLALTRANALVRQHHREAHEQASQQAQHLNDLKTAFNRGLEMRRKREREARKTRAEPRNDVSDELSAGASEYGGAGQSEFGTNTSNFMDDAVEEEDEDDESMSSRSADGAQDTEAGGAVRNNSAGEDRINEEDEQEMKATLKDNAARIRALRYQHKEEVEALKSEQKEEMDTLKSDHQRRSSDLLLQHETDLKNMRAAQAQDRKLQTQAHARELATAREAFQKEKVLMERLHKEQAVSNNLLHQMLPPSVATKLKLNEPIEPEMYDESTVFFSDICGFTSLTSKSTPLQIVNLLNRLYTGFDDIIDLYDAYKVETIGDSYMIVSGVPRRNGSRHAAAMADVALHLLRFVQDFDMSDQNEQVLRLRLGFHSGPVLSGVVGAKMPRYCLFGDTVNTASRMESTGEELKVHVSENSYELLKDDYMLEMRGQTAVKGKGNLTTYWLLCKKEVGDEAGI